MPQLVYVYITLCFIFMHIVSCTCCYAQIKDSVVINQQLSNKIEDLKKEIYALKEEKNKEVYALKEEKYQALSSKADITMSVANSYIQWTGGIFVMVTLLVTVIIGFAGFFGIKELNKLKSLSKNLEKEISEEKVNFASKSADVKKDFDMLRKDFSQKIELLSNTFFEASYNFTEGEKNYKLGKNILAIEYFSKAVKIQPTSYAYGRLGRAYTNLDKFEDAIRCFEKALESPSVEGDADALYGMSMAYRYVDLSKAIEFSMKATEKDKRNSDAFNYLGLLYRDSEEFDNAIDAHQKSLNLDKRAVTYFYLSLLYNRKRLINESKKYIRLAVGEIPNEERKNTIKPLWLILIESCNMFIEGKSNEAIVRAADMQTFITSERAYKAIVGHFHFLLYESNQNDEMRRLQEVIKINSNI